jgi:hypothetical protein
LGAVKHGPGELFVIFVFPEVTNSRKIRNVMEVVVIRGTGPTIDPAADSVNDCEIAAAVSGIFYITAGSLTGDNVAGIVIAVVINPSVASCSRVEGHEYIAVASAAISAERAKRDFSINVVPCISFSHFEPSFL